MGFKILVADDSITIQKIVAMAFENESVVVEGIGNGQAALDFLPEFEPDIVLADIDMPGLDGFELSRQIKTSRKFGDLPVLLLASDFEDFDEQKFLDSQADDYISKPFKSDDIVFKVHGLLGTAPGPAAADHPVAAEPPDSSLIDEELRSLLEDTEFQETVLSEAPEDSSAEVPAGDQGVELTESQLRELSGEPADPVAEEASEPEPEDAEEAPALNSEETVLAEVQKDIAAVPDLPAADDAPALQPVDEDALLAELTVEMEEPRALEEMFRRTRAADRAPSGEDAIREESDDLLAELAPGTFAPGALEDKPDLIRETLQFLSGLPPETAPAPARPAEEDILAQAEALDLRNEKYNKVMGQHIMHVLEKSMDTSMRQEIGGLSEGILNTVREVVREIAPGIIRSVIKEEIENIKKAEQV